MAKKTKKQLESDLKSKILRTTINYRNEAKAARFTRLQQNQTNFDVYNLKVDTSHKSAGQSQEILPKVRNSVEQIASFIQQGVSDLGENWFSVSVRRGVVEEELLGLKAEEVKQILLVQLKHAQFYTALNDLIKLGLLGSLMPAKIDGEMVPKPKFRATKGDGKLKEKLVKTKDKAWQLRIRTMRHEDYFPDPTGEDLYKGQRIEMDAHKLVALSKGPNAIYDEKAVKVVIESLGTDESIEQQTKKAEESDQDVAQGSIRRKISVYEWHGDIVDPTTHELLFENVMWTTSSNFDQLLQAPLQNAFWHGGDPFVVAPIIRMPNSVWHKALMDSGVFLNLAVNEMFNLMLDGGMMAVHGIKQLRKDFMDDEDQATNGFSPGDTIDVHGNMPAGMKILETVVTGDIPTDGFNMFQALNSEYLQSTLSNDLRLGNLPGRTTQATEVVTAEQNLNNVFNAVGKNIESGFIQPLLEKSILTIAQHANDLASEELVAVLGLKRTQEIAALTKAELFSAIANGFRFKVTGISTILSKSQDFRKWTAMLQTIASSEILAQEFSQKFSFAKLLAEIFRSLDLSPDKITKDEEESAPAQGAAPAQAGQNQANNVPQVATLGETLGIPREDFDRGQGEQQIRGERG